MALSKSVADVIQEDENWLRLATFLHEPLKNALLSVLHNSINDPKYIGLPDNPLLLYQEFSKHGNKIAQLVKKRVLQQDQVDLLLPPNDNKTYSSKFDVTLIVVLIINFTTLTPPLNGWKDKNPPAHDRSKGASVIRGRQWRNYIHHNEPKDIDQVNFNQKWAEGTQIINDLGYHYDTNKLKTMSLDPKHELVLKSLFLVVNKRLNTKVGLMEAKHDLLEAKHDLLEAKHDSLEAQRELDLKLDTILRQRLQKIESEVKDLRSERKSKEYSDTVSSGSFCLKSVLEYISKEIKEEEAEELVALLHVKADGDLVNVLNYVPWKKIKTELEMLGRKDIVEYIRRNTLITREASKRKDVLADLIITTLGKPKSTTYDVRQTKIYDVRRCAAVLDISSPIDLQRHNRSVSNYAGDLISEDSGEFYFIQSVTRTRQGYLNVIQANKGYVLLSTTNRKKLLLRKEKRCNVDVTK